MVKGFDSSASGGQHRHRSNDGDIALTLGDLGAGLLDAGYAVTDVQQALRAVGEAHGRADLTIGVLPSAIMVDDPRSGRTRLINSTGAALTFDPGGRRGEIARAAELGRVGLAGGPDRVRAARDRPPRFPRPVAVLGSGLQSAGIAVVFRTTWWGVALDFVLALLVGAVLIYGGRIAGLITVLPIVAAFCGVSGRLRVGSRPATRRRHAVRGLRAAGDPDPGCDDHHRRGRTGRR